MRIIVLICLAFLFNYIPLNGQNFIVINEADNECFQIKFPDTIIQSSYGCLTGQNEYYFDLDDDASFDIHFDLQSYMGGFGSYSWMWLNTLNDFSLIIDPYYQSVAEYIDSNYQVQSYLKTYTIAKKFSINDTIRLTEPHQSSRTILTNVCNGHEPQLQFDNAIPFVGDTTFIAFYKKSTNPISVYYLKLYMPSTYSIHIFYGKTNDEKFNFDYSDINVYPNPFSETITVKGSFDHFMVYSIDGTLVHSGNLYFINPSIDLSFLNKGFYILKLFEGNDSFVKKIVKF
jgi:hypothetical protein